MTRNIFVLLSILALSASPAAAQSRTNVLDAPGDPRGLSELTICSQNLEMYGLLEFMKEDKPSYTVTDLEEKDFALADRFASQSCDVIAVQEIVGKTEVDGKRALEHLARALRRRMNRYYDTAVGETADSKMRVGFLVAKDKADIISTLSYARVELPQLTPKDKPKLFSRGPLEIQISVRGQGDAPSKIVNLVNLHFKSKHGGQNDPAALEWETTRMQMAEALRRIIEDRFSQSFANNKTPLVVLGDRNANFDVASAKILEGSLILKNFQGDGPCRLSKRGVPLCKPGTASPQRLFSVLLGDPETKARHGTFEYKGVYSWLDDILMPAESLPYAWERFDSTANYSSGVVSQPEEASDHAMVWTRLNW